MIVTCSKCHTKVQRPTKNLKINAERLGKTLEEYLSSYLCRKCASGSKEEITNENVNNDNNESTVKDKKEVKKIEDVPKIDGLYTAKLCLNCANSCKIGVVTLKAVVTCPKFTRRKDNV
jgi:hypothetical protein